MTYLNGLQRMEENDISLVFVFVPKNRTLCRMSCVLWLVADNVSWPITQARISWCLRGSKCEILCYFFYVVMVTLSS